MNKKSQRGILGLVALTAVAVIFMPVLTDRPADSSSAAVMLRPPAPAVPDVPAYLAAAKEAMTKPLAYEPPLQGVPELLSDQRSSGSLDEQGLPIAWSIQLPSFSDPKEAAHLQKELIRHSFPTYLHTASDSAGELVFYVCIGPHLSWQKISEQLVRLRTELHVEGVIVRFSS